jgi:hypothetical protein
VISGAMFIQHLQASGLRKEYERLAKTKVSPIRP